MIIPIELRFKADKDSKSVFRTEKTIKSHDINTVEFHITIEGLELTGNHTAKILSLFHSSKSQANVDCEIVDGKIIYKPDTKLISRHEHVTNYVYVYNNNQSLDVREFTYVVDLSKIDETSLEAKEVYDQSYADLLADFEQALNGYKDNLPKADSVRADIDEILNQFSEDSQAKLSQYDTDVQQVITNINEAEESRVQAEGQRDSAESSRVQSEAQRASKESSRVSAESERVLAEDDRENAEEQRKVDHANRSAELDGKADKVVIRNLVENGDFSEGIKGWRTYGYGTGLEVIDGVAKTTNYSGTSRGFIQTLSEQQNTGDSIYVTLNARIDHPDMFTNIFILSHYALTEKTNISGPIINLTRDFVQLSGIVKYEGEFILRVLYNFKELGEYPAYLKDVVAINLTETFGAGNEPTKEEMDELIKVTGYIDGEYALNNKEMLGYLMNSVDEKTTKKQEEWITPTLLNGAVGTLKYRKNNFGRVEFIGDVNYPTDGSKPFLSLPSGYHIGENIRFSIASLDGFLSNVLIIGQNMIFPSNLANKTVNLSHVNFIV